MQLSRGSNAKLSDYQQSLYNVDLSFQTIIAIFTYLLSFVLLTCAV